MKKIFLIKWRKSTEHIPTARPWAIETYSMPVTDMCNPAQIPFGMKSNDPFLLTLAHAIAINGFCPNPEESKPMWVPPSQILDVTIVFQD